MSAPGTGATPPSQPQTDYTETFHHFTEKDYKENQAWDKAIGGHEDSAGFLRPDSVSNNDTDRIHFGVEEPDNLVRAASEHEHGQQQLSRYSQSISFGDLDAVGKADDILTAGEPGLAFFKFFAPAYNDWTGGGVSYGSLKDAYEAEYGMSFADYSADSKTMADLSQQLVTIQQNLNNSYNALVPTWQGDAAATFAAKMAVFFKAAGTVTQDVAASGKDVASLVQGLQQLILAKAQTVSELYADELPKGIDGVMAQSMVRVAKGEGDKQLNLTAFFLLGGKIKKQGGWLHYVANIASLGSLDDLEKSVSESVAAQAAPMMAADWCNSVLIPQFETREHACDDVNTQTQRRIQQGFQEFTSQLSGLQDPFAGMAAAKAPTKHQPKPATGGTATQPAGGGGAPGGGAGGGPTLPQSTPTLPQSTPSIPTRPAGLPTGASWIPPGVALPSGWTHDPTTGAALPTGWTVDPTTGSPTQAAYRVHFDQHGDPVVTEVVPTAGADGLDDITSPASQRSDDVVSGGAAGGASFGAGGGGIGGGDAVHPDTAAAADSAPLPDGAHVGADNAMGAASTDGSTASPVAGSAAPPDQGSSGQHAGGIGAMPMGGGMGRGGGGQEQESGRKYLQHGDVVGEDDLEEWQRMGPVIGEQ